MAWTEADQARKNIEDAKKGLFGNAKDEVIKKNQTVLDNLSGKNKTPVYVGTGSAIDKAIKDRVAKRSSSSSTARPATMIELPEEWNVGAGSGSNLGLVFGGIFLFLLLLRR